MILESVRIALRSLGANKLRAVLTMLGIVIGVGAVITLMSVGRGVQQYITAQFQGIGSNLLFVIPGRPQDFQQGGNPMRLTTGTLTNGDVTALRDLERVPDALAVTGVDQRVVQVEAGRRSKSIQVTGVGPDYSEIRNWTVSAGRFIDPVDMSSYSRIAVIGQTVADDLFPDAWPIGQTIKIRQVAFRIVGIMEKKGGSQFVDQDNVILVPLTTAQQRLFNSRSPSGDWRVSVIFVRAVSDDRMSAVSQEVAEVLRERHNITYRDDDDFQVFTQADLLSAFSQVTGVITLFLGAIAGISLVVGGIGIMNIMLVSVTERTREIGLRKAIGAKRRNILLQFLIEAVTLAVVGGVMGVLLGELGAFGISRLSTEFSAVVAPDAVALALAFSAAVGLFFGIYPAWRAAGLNPIDALRYE